MHRQVRSLTLSLFTAPALAAMVMAGPTPATASPAADDRAASHPAATTAAEQSNTLHYWTPKRMAVAEPLNTLRVTRDEVAGRIRQLEQGLPATIPPTDDSTGDTETQAADSTGQPWTGSGEVTHTGGRVFFTTGGQDASCSGNAVTSENMSVVVTAGHCVKYQGAWATNWVFVPGYDHGQRPHGTWAARELLTTSQWEAGEDINYDVGMAVMSPRDGQHLTEAVGGQGIAFNQPRGQQMYAFGYPAADPYDGADLIYCSGQAFNDPLLSNDQGLNCDMTGGSSGGPWFVDFDEGTGAGIQNSVNSFKYVFLPDVMFGPYFGDSVQNLYQRAQTA